jgi:hypothetical protein
LDEAIGLRNAIETPAPAVHDPVAIYRAATGAAKVQAYRSLPPQTRNRIIEAQRAPEPEFDLEAYRRRCEADPY